MVRRWTRLFPAMVVATVLVYATTGLFVHRPGGQPQPIDVLPGLLFLQPELLSAIFGTKVAAIEGAFWSLYVEVKFPSAGRVALLPRRSPEFDPALFVWLPPICLLDGQGPAERAGTDGAAAHRLRRTGAVRQAPAVVRHRHSGLRIRNHADEIGHEEWAMLALSVVFALRHYRKGFVPDGPDRGGGVPAVALAEVRSAMLRTRLLFLGFVGYPLYLVNENAGVSMIVDLTPLLSPLPMALVPLVPMLVLSGWPALAKYGARRR